MADLFRSLYTFALIAGDRVKAVKDEERGASAVEYALLVGLIAAAVVAAVTLFRPMLEGLFRNINVNGQ